MLITHAQSPLFRLVNNHQGNEREGKGKEDTGEGKPLTTRTNTHAFSGTLWKTGKLSVQGMMHSSIADPSGAWFDSSCMLFMPNLA